MKFLSLGLLVVILVSCNINKTEEKSTEPESDSYSDIVIVGAMKEVMWKGELGGKIKLDTISNKEGLYGLGPVSYMKGELLINNGQSYAARVNSDSTMTVEKTIEVSAPFFVYSNVTEWEEHTLSPEIKTIQDLEKFIDSKTKSSKRPFTFKLTGHVSEAKIHIQNLPDGTEVSSPEEAHQGQVSYAVNNEDAEIVGFFSTEHKGVFTHHDSFLHMHLITKDETKMGHLDALEIGSMKLYLPKK